MRAKGVLTAATCSTIRCLVQPVEIANHRFTQVARHDDQAVDALLHQSFEDGHQVFGVIDIKVAQQDGRILVLNPERALGLPAGAAFW